MKTETYITMEYKELDSLVKSYFPQADFDFIANEELHDEQKYLNNISKDMEGCTKEGYLNWTATDRKSFNEMILGKMGCDGRSYMFIEFFVGNDILPEGKYLIDVSW